MVLQCPGHDLRCRGGFAIDQHNHRVQVSLVTPTDPIRFLSRRAAPVRNDSLSLGQKTVGHLYAGAQQAAPIVSKIQDESGEILPGQLLQSLINLPIRRFAKVFQPDIADTGFHQRRQRNARTGDLRPDDFDLDLLIHTLTSQAQDEQPIPSVHGRAEPLLRLIGCLSSGRLRWQSHPRAECLHEKRGCWETENRQPSVP